VTAKKTKPKTKRKAPVKKKQANYRYLAVDSKHIALCEERPVLWDKTDEEWHEAGGTTTIIALATPGIMPCGIWELCQVDERRAPRRRKG